MAHWIKMLATKPKGHDQSLGFTRYKRTDSHTLFSFYTYIVTHIYLLAILNKIHRKGKTECSLIYMTKPFPYSPV